MKRLRMRHYASGPRKGYWLVSGGAWEMLVGPFGDADTAYRYANVPPVVDRAGTIIEARMRMGHEVVNWQARHRETLRDLKWTTPWPYIA